MRFTHLAGKLSPFILGEKYLSYEIPTLRTKKWGGNNVLDKAETNKYLMHDFYVLDYLKFLVDKMPPKQFRDLNPDLEDSVQDAVKKLFPYLRQELLDAVFYSMCAEFRHSTQSGNFANLIRLTKDSKERKLYSDWLKYMRVKAGSYSVDELETLDIQNPSSDVRTPELEKNNSAERNLSYKAANYSIKNNNATKQEFVEMMKQVFGNGIWHLSYGGNAWAKIANGWQMLNASDEITPLIKQSSDSLKKPMSVAIDHVYDLQHNTDTVFNKLKSYHHPRNGWAWIQSALDEKANTKSYHDLLQNTSGSVKAMALPVLYNRLGGSWEEHVRKTRPEDLYDVAEETAKKLEAEQKAAEKAAKEAHLLQKLKSKYSDDESDFQPEELNSANVKPGDIVICVDDSGFNLKLTVGKEYIVRKVHNNTITVMDDNNTPAEVYFHRFRTTGRKSNGDNSEEGFYTAHEMQNFPDVNKSNTKVRDKILGYQNSGISKYITLGKAYTVKEINRHLVQIQDNSGEYHSYKHDRFKKKPDEQQPNYELWKDGDILRCIDNEGVEDTLHIGQLYRAKGEPKKLEQTNQHSIIVVDLEDNQMGSFNTNRFKNVHLTLQDTKKDSRKTHNFKIGDSVKHKGHGGEGKVTEIFTGPNGEPGVEVKLPDGSIASWKSKNVIPQPKESETEYEVGDSVEYTPDESKTYTGNVLKITQFNNETNLVIYFKELNDQINLKASDPQLKKASSSLKPSPESTPVVGDKVIVTTDDGKIIHGIMNDITSISNKGWVDVPKGSGWHLSSWYPMKQIKKAPRLFKQKVETEEEPKIHDDVSVETPDGNYLYGTLSYINHEKDLGYVSIPTISGHGKSDWFELSKIKKDVKI